MPNDRQTPPVPLVPISELKRTAKNGDWFVLWPGQFGPFTALWRNGQWNRARFGDIARAQFGVQFYGENLTRNDILKADPFPGDTPKFCPTCDQPVIAIRDTSPDPQDALADEWTGSGVGEDDSATIWIPVVVIVLSVIAAAVVYL
jgi:hypothetical protein